MRSARRRVLAGCGMVAAVSALTWLGLIGPADAHQGAVTAACVDGDSVLTINLTNYNTDGVNTIAATDGALPLAMTTFGATYQHSFTLPGDVAHTYTVTVHAFDDPNGAKGFTFTDTAATPDCTTTTTTTPSTTTTTPSTTTTAPSTTTMTTTTPVPATRTSTRPVGAVLASTGANPTVGLLVAVLLLTIGTALLITTRARRAHRNASGR